MFLATGQVIILTSADQRVLPISSVELIGTSASLQQIVTCVTIEMIGAGIAIQHIVAPLSTDSVIAIIPMNEVVRGVALQDVAVDRSAQCQRLECDIRPDGAIGEVQLCDTEPANTIVIEINNYANTVALRRTHQQIV